MSPRGLAARCGAWLSLILLPASAWGNSPTAETTGEDELFRIGGSCAGLAFLETEEIRRHVALALGDELEGFCYPEEPFDCSDYSGFLKGIGTLVSSEDAAVCRLNPDA